MTAIDKVESIWFDLEGSYKKSGGSRIDFLKKLLAYKESVGHGSVDSILLMVKKGLDLSDERQLGRYNRLESLLKNADANLTRAIANGSVITNLDEFVCTKIDDATESIDLFDYDVFTVTRGCSPEELFALGYSFPCSVLRSDFRPVTHAVDSGIYDFLSFSSEADVLDFVKRMSPEEFAKSSPFEQYTLYLLLELVKTGACRLPLVVTVDKHAEGLHSIRGFVCKTTDFTSGLALSGTFRGLHGVNFAIPTIESVSSLVVSPASGTDGADGADGTVYYVSLGGFV